MRIKLIIGVVLLLITNIITAQNLGESTVYVNGNCDMCKSTIEKTAMASPGVIHARWNSKDKSLNLIYNKELFLMDATLIQLGNAGYDNEDYVASEEVYNRLPLCCQYRETSTIDLDAYHKIHDKKDVTNKFIKGVIYDHDANNQKQTLPGVHIYFLGSEMGVMSDENGLFSLPLRSKPIETIIVSYLGYQNDTLKVESDAWVEVTLNDGILMNEVVIQHRKKTTEYSFINPLKIESINQGELEKAACCNLSESFTTNASVDDSATDAVTGTRQIQLLGLASPYVQITLEKVPYVRGLSAISGFNLVPGPWIRGIQLNTGTGSVSDGYEAMTGQINVQYKTPESDEKLFVNLYGNKSGAIEANIVTRLINTERVQSSLLVHAKNRTRENDNNKDGFLDMPLVNNLLVTNKWRFKLSDTWKSRVMINTSIRDESGGQYAKEDIPSMFYPWKLELDEKKLDGYIKTGKIFKNKKKTSLGIIASGSYHEQSTQYGAKQYDATHKNLFGNMIYESIIGTDNHKYRVGLSFQSDIMDETILFGENNTKKYKRDEQVLGAYGEYTYKYSDRFTSVLGLRGDIHNKHGFFFTPRLHLRYMPIDDLVFRASIGRGTRTASIFSENPGIFVTSRTIIVEGEQETDTPYGLKREDSWTMGGNISYTWTIWGKETLLSSDYYLTDFVNQVVIDWDNPTEVRFYNLDGKSYSKSFKTQWDIEIIDQLDMRLAYRYNDVQTDYKSGRKEKPLNSAHRFFINLGYKTARDWKFDMTLNRQGEKRLPDTYTNLPKYQLAERSPAFYTLAGQISKTWGNWEIYLGGENITNFKQPNPIIWQPVFDASRIWGPVFGSNFYLGMRYTLKDKEI